MPPASRADHVHLLKLPHLLFPLPDPFLGLLPGRDVPTHAGEPGTRPSSPLWNGADMRCLDGHPLRRLSGKSRASEIDSGCGANLLTLGGYASGPLESNAYGDDPLTDNQVRLTRA